MPEGKAEKREEENWLQELILILSYFTSVLDLAVTILLMKKKEKE